MSGQAGATRFNTLAIHAGMPPSPLSRTPAPGVPNGRVADEAPLALQLFEGRDNGTESSQAILEERIAALEGGSAALAVASGRAARLIACQVLMQPGDEIVVPRDPACGSLATFDQSFKGFGWRARRADPENPESFVEALSDKTKAILIESISYPDGIVADIEAIARVAQRARVPLIVDNSFATPFLMRPLEHGADVVLYSTTRFLGGPGSTAGLIVDGGTFDWANDARYPALTQPLPDQRGLVISDAFGNFAFAVACRVLGLRDLGQAAPPLDAATTMRGIETLPLRMQRHCENALAVAQHLRGHAAVERVHYPGLPDGRGHASAQRYLTNGGGAVLAVTLTGGDEAAGRLMRRLKLFSHLGEAGDTRSQIVHPAAAPGRGPNSGSNAAAGLVLASIGLEDRSDIIADLDQALAG